MYLGIDIGTTSVCAVVLDKTGKILSSRSSPTPPTVLRGEERTQNANEILSLCETLCREIKSKYSVKSIGISGQMHGILYLDKNGNALSPLYSWQDNRGNLPYRTLTYADALKKLTQSHGLSSGYGAVSLFFDAVNKKIPKDTASFCTIGDFVAMRFAGKTTPLLHSSDAASVGLFSLTDCRWNESAFEKAKIPCSLLPPVTNETTFIGQTQDGIDVLCAVGDNQASVYGATNTEDAVIVNIGTGSQVSVICEHAVTPPENCELRPYFHRRYLLAGTALCGGYAYQLLKNFFNCIGAVFGKEISFEQMNEWAMSAINCPLPLTDTRFKGTREKPETRASIVNLSENNFTPQCLTLSVLKGINRELFELYENMTSAAEKRTVLIAAGNAVRKNRVLQTIIKEDFGLPLHIPVHEEEAAFGAALLAAEQYEGKRLIDFIRYKTV